MPLVFDDEVSAPPASAKGRLVFDDEQPGSADFQSAQTAPSQPEAAAPRQTPLETGARAAAQAPGQTMMNAYSGLGRAAQTAADTLRQKLPGPLGTVAGNMAELYSYIPRHLGPLAKDIANESERVYAPDRERNPKAATVGAAVGQALPMAASAIVAGPSGPLALGAGQGMDQGLDQAEQMGITSPARKLALGAAYAGIEAGVERLGGFGSKAFTAPAKRTLMEMAKAGGKTVLSEGVEEPITGALQDAAAVALAPPSYDSTDLRPFVMTPSGVPVPNQSYFDRRGLETLGGLAGGTVGAGVQALANRAQPGTKNQEQETTSDPLAAFAAQMPERAAVDPVSVESGMFDAPMMEGDILRDFNVQPDVAARVSQAEQDGAAWDADQAARQAAYNQQFPILPEDQRAQLDDIVTRMEAAGEPESAIRATVAGFQTQLGTRNQEPGTSSASVTPEASPVPIPEAPASAPVSPEADAGSTPAAGISSPAVAGGIDPGNPGPMDRATAPAPAFGSAAPVGTTRQVPVIPDAPYGGRDVLDFVNDNNIAVPRAILDVIQEKKGAKLAPQSKGDFNWLEKYGVPKGFRKYLFGASEDQTSNINEVAQLAHDEGLISDPTPDALMGKILETIDAREGYTRDVDAREKQLAAEEKALIAREKAEAKRQQSWADEVINGSMETPFIGIDPKLMAAYTVKGAQLIKEGFTTFAKWSREMISRFGERVRDYLQGAWDSALKNSEKGRLDILPPKPQRGGGKQAEGVSLGDGESWIVQGLTEAPLDAGTAGRIVSRESSQPETYTDSGRSIPDYYGSRASIQDIFSEEQRLIQRAQSEGFFWQPEQVQSVLKQVRKRAGGGEHDVFLHGTETAPLVLRSTINDSYGLQGRSPAQYLKRVEDYNALFPALQMRVIGVSKNARGNGVIWTAQPFVEGREFKEDSELQKAMEKAGWKRISSDTTYEHSITGAVIQDVHTGNVLTDGKELYPIDVVVLKNPNQGFKNLDTSGTTAGFLNTDIINEGASLIARGVRDFAAWSKAMVQKFGAAIRDYLQGAWQAAIKNSQAGGSLPNGEKPGTRNQEPGTDIHLTHAAVDASRAAEGRSEIPHGGQGTTEQWQAEAAQRLADDPRAGYTLTAKLIANPRQLDKIEEALMRAHVGQLQQRSANASAELDNPATDPAQREEAAAIYSAAQAELDQTEIAVSLAGSAWGAAGRARQMGLKRGEVPSLSQMVADITLIQDPTGKTPLPPEERAVIEKTHAKMVEAEQALEKQREEGKGGAQETYNSELQRLLDEAKAEIAEHQAIIETQREILKDKGAPVKLYTKSKAKLQEWSDAGDAAMQRLRDKGFFAQANMGVDVSVIGDLAEVLRGWMSKGVLNTASLTAKLMTTMGEKNFMQVKKFLPQIFDKADQLAREGAKKKTPDEILAKGRKAAAANEGKLPRSLARQLALAHIVDHIERKDKTLSAAKIADLVRADLEEFQPGITTREARDLISGYGQATFPSKDEARAELRNLAAQMQKITQLEALRNKERLLKSGPQRDKPSAELRELQKQVEELKKEIGYEARSKEDELKSARDRIKSHLENQIEELQRVLAGKSRPANPREAVVYDAELNALKDLRGSLRDLVAEMPEHKLASEARRNKAALKSAQKSEAEWNRRAAAAQWKRPGKPPAAVSAEVDAARAKAKEARANFEALKKAADPRNDPEARSLRDFKRRTQKSIDDINTKIRTGAYDPPKKTPRQIQHDKESEKLKHDLAIKKREWIDLKLQHRMATMGWGGKGLELVRKLYHLARSLKAGGEFSGVLNQGMIPMVTHPLLTFGSIPKMFKAFVSPQNETAIMDQIWARGNSINGRYKKHKLAINDHMDYSTMQAEGNYRSAWGNKIPFFAGTGRAYTTLLNHMRADLFDHLVSKLEARKARRNETVTARELDMIAEEVNNSTGHGKLPFGLNNGNAKDLLGAVIFSPSFVMARARYLAGTSLWGGSKDSRAIIATERVRTMAGFAALYALALAMQGDDDEEMNLTEPRDSTWMKPKLSRTYIDLLAGLQQIAVLASRLATGTSITNGKKTDLTDPNGRMDRFDLLLKFGKSKRSPALTMADEFINRKDYNGKPITRAEAAWNSITPITAGSIRDLIENEPPELAVPLSAGALFGLRTDTRAPRQ